MLDPRSNQPTIKFMDLKPGQGYKNRLGADKNPGRRPFESIFAHNSEKNRVRFPNISPEASRSQFYNNHSYREEPRHSKNGFSMDGSFLTPNRLAKTFIRQIVKNPITGATKNFENNRKPVRSLGSSQPVYFPGKIFDSPISRDHYKPPAFAKTIKRNTSYNPVIHQSLDYSQYSFKSAFPGIIN